MTELLAYVVDTRSGPARTALAAACASLGVGLRIETFGTGALYQRLSQRPVPPPPDLVWWFGPFAARAAAWDGLLQSAQAVDYSVIGVVGADRVDGFAGLATVPRLAVADPARSEAGMAILLVSLDGARRTGNDVEAVWAWWRQRADSGLVLVETDADATRSGATHALTLTGGAPLPDLAPIPHMVGVAANSRNADAARRLLEELVGGRRTPEPGPALDVDWCTQSYIATRQRWAEAGFSPALAG
jgi:hypothetical protein